MPIEPPTPPSAAANAMRVLVIRHGAFGDLVQASGALRDIREHHAGAHLSLLVAPQYAPLMRRCPYVDATIEDPRAPLLDPRRSLGLLRRLRAQRFDRVYDLQGSDRTRLYRLMLARPGVPWSRNDNPGDGPTPDRLAYAELLARAGVPAAHAATPQVRWMAGDVSALLATAGVAPGYVALIPGSAARHPHKRWPHYAELARRLAARGIEAVVAPGPDELELARTLPCRTLLGPHGEPLDWFRLAGVLDRAAFVIGNDTGPTHLAAALGRPGLALFGPHTRAQRTGILLPGFDAIEAPDLQALGVDEVLARAERMGLPARA